MPSSGVVGQAEVDEVVPVDVCCVEVGVVVVDGLVEVFIVVFHHQRFSKSLPDGSWVDAALAAAPVTLAVVGWTSAEMLAATTAESTTEDVATATSRGGLISEGASAFRIMSKSKSWADPRRANAAATRIAVFMVRYPIK